MFILEGIENVWNYTFIVVAIIAIIIGAVLEYRKAKKNALKELGYMEINEDNAKEVFEKIAEIQSRKV